MYAPHQKPPLGMPINYAHPLEQGCVLHLGMQEGMGNKLFDLSGYGNHGTLTNMAFPPTVSSGWNPGKFGPALQFDGTDDYVDCGNGASLNITDAITIEAWVYSSNFTQDYKSIVGKHYDAYLLRTRSTTGQLNFRIQADTSGEAYTQTVLSNNTWYHVAATYDKNGGTNNMKIYLNGILKDQNTKTGSLNTNSYNVNIGRRSDNINYFNGTIDEVRIYNRALSAEEIWQLAHFPFCTYEPQYEIGWLYSAPPAGIAPLAMYHYEMLRA